MKTSLLNPIASSPSTRNHCAADPGGWPSPSPRKLKAGVLLLCFAPLLFTSCAFDLTQVKQLPASFQPVAGAPQRWRLGQEAKIAIGTGYTTRLQSGTRWAQVGRLAQGDVFKTADQVVTVEAANIHEAYLVVKDGAVTGFYLPVERTFTPVNPPKPIQITPQ